MSNGRNGPGLMDVAVREIVHRGQFRCVSVDFNGHLGAVLRDVWTEELEVLGVAEREPLCAACVLNAEVAA